MKCPQCGVDYPNKIYKIHVKMCKESEQEGEITFVNPYLNMKYNEMRALAKERGLKFDGNPSRDDLETALVGSDSE